MKKFLLSLFVASSAVVSAQTTLTSHFEGALINPADPAVGTFSWTGGDGYVSGSNNFGDEGIVQLFDNNYGVSGEGVINSVKVHIAHKDQGVNPTGTFSIGVWENNAGVPGALLASEVITIVSVDTTQSGVNLITEGTTLKGLYNVEATFINPPSIPANGSFFAGVLLPTTIANGDTIVVLTTTPPYVFMDSTTHAGAFAGTDFFSYGESEMSISNAIFPTVTFNAVSVSTVIKDQAKVFPNPANDVLNIDFGTEEVKEVNITNLNGQVVIQNKVVNNGIAKLDLSGLNSGLYLYQAIDTNGKGIATDKFSKK